MPSKFPHEWCNYYSYYALANEPFSVFLEGKRIPFPGWRNSSAKRHFFSYIFLIILWRLIHQAERWIKANNSSFIIHIYKTSVSHRNVLDMINGWSMLSILVGYLYLALHLRQILQLMVAKATGDWPLFDLSFHPLLSKITRIFFDEKTSSSSFFQLKQKSDLNCLLWSDSLGEFW